MSAHPEDQDWTQSREREPIQVIPDVGTDYNGFRDEQLIIERDRRRKQLDELTMAPRQFARGHSASFQHRTRGRTNDGRTNPSCPVYEPIVAEFAPVDCDHYGHSQGHRGTVRPMVETDPDAISSRLREGRRDGDCKMIDSTQA